MPRPGSLSPPAARGLHRARAGGSLVSRPKKVPLCVSVQNVEVLDEADALLESIEDELATLECRFPLLDCRVTIENGDGGPCRVRVELTLPDSRHASALASGADLCCAVRGAFGACGRLAVTA